MSLPEISFEKIRAYEGSRHAGFEELCSQLAALEVAGAAERFFRKGRGGDAGVECYCQNQDGSETGWQAKYLFGWDSGLSSQLNDSIATAIDKHPKLTQYIVCLPFDLPDSRSGKGKTALEKWQDWRAGWEKKALVLHRNLRIDLWGKSQLVERLASGKDASTGRLLYWFDSEPFTQEWFASQFATAKAALGSRYTPETSVELPIRSEFLAAARDPSLQKEVDAWFFQLGEEGKRAADAIVSAAGTAAMPHVESLRLAVGAIVEKFGQEPTRADQDYPLSDWEAESVACLKVAREVNAWAYENPALLTVSSSGSDPGSSAKQSLRQLIESLGDIRDALSSRRWRIANAKNILLTGEAGSGKSHLLAEVVEHQIVADRPALLLLGSSFRDDEPWRQILGQLDRPPSEQIKHFLGALDAAAEVAGVRALICIDALNERNGIEVWPSRLAAFLQAVEAFPRLMIVVSCRTTYIPHVIPDNLAEKQLERILHHGFSVDGGEAAKVYLDKRGVVRPGAPNLAPEFENPLFLKTCCDFLEKEGKTALPRGLRGVTSIFGFFNDAVSRAITKRMGLDPRFDIVPKAISGFARLLASAGQGYIDKSEAIQYFESLSPSSGRLERSLLSQLETEGLLAVEPVRRDDGSFNELVRFTYERFSDHAIATRLLSENLDSKDVAGSFIAGSPLHEVVHGQRRYQRAGIIEAIAVQLPEQTGVELLDVCELTDWNLRQPFLDSLLWREQSQFTDRTFEIAKELLGKEDLTNLLISISTEPENKFNALYVHGILNVMSMPDRDAFWSVYLAETGFTGAVETLVSWAVNNGNELIDEERAYLAVLMLTWFLTTTHRTVRDKATKALAALLGRRLKLASRLLQQFDGTNDPYLAERLLASCYGAAMQGSTDGLSGLAEVIFDLNFANGKPPTDALAREHAQGLIEFAAWRGVLPSRIDMSLARPPYASPWPIEHVPQDLIDSYVEVGRNGTFRDSIVSSAVNDGDFARYQMDGKVDNWSPSSIGTDPLPTSQDVYEEWLRHFRGWASVEQLAAFESVVAAALLTKDTGGYQKTPETEQFDIAISTMKRAVASEQWEDFRVRAYGFVRHQLHRDWRDTQPASFDKHWARRWVCKRAHELGWTQELFGDFERQYIKYDRTEHEIERVGKKYQWIAFRELVARMADNLAYIGSSWERRGGMPTYSGARQIGLRDIDPSLLAMSTKYDGWAEWGKTWWVPVAPVLRPASPLERISWLKSDRDVLNQLSLIEVQPATSERKWLTLASFSHWRGRGLVQGKKEYQRETWFRLRCLVVEKRSEAKLIKELKGQILTEPHRLPKLELHGEFYLGEYPWHPELEDVDCWTSPDEVRGTSTPVRAVVASYSCEKGGYDHSIDSTISVEIPAPWLAVAMGLRLVSGRSPTFADARGKVVFLDPSVSSHGPSAALVDRAEFLVTLEREGLAAVWIIAGEKSAFGGQDSGWGFGGRFLHTAIYQLTNKGFVRHFHSRFEDPTPEQLDEYFGESDRQSTALETPKSDTKPASAVNGIVKSVKKGPKKQREPAGTSNSKPNPPIGAAPQTRSAHKAVSRTRTSKKIPPN